MEFKQFQNIIFDDFVEDQYSNWTQICQNCILKYTIQQYVRDTVPVEGIICGVKNCYNEADYYLDFKDEKKLD